MLIRRFSLILLSSAFLMAPAAFAQSGKIAFVDTDRLLREAPPALAAQSKLEQEFSRREQELTRLGNELQKASDDFDRDAPTMSESQRQTRQRQLLERDREFQRRQREFQEDLNLRKQEELQRVLDEATRVVEQIARSNNYDVILQEAVYINPSIDITDRVIQSMGR